MRKRTRVPSSSWYNAPMPYLLFSFSRIFCVSITSISIITHHKFYLLHKVPKWPQQGLLWAMAGGHYEVEVKCIAWSPCRTLSAGSHECGQRAAVCLIRGDKWLYKNEPGAGGRWADLCPALRETGGMSSLSRTPTIRTSRNPQTFSRTFLSVFLYILIFLSFQLCSPVLKFTWEKFQAIRHAD